MHSRAHFSLHYFAVLEAIFLMLPLQTSLKTKKKKNLKCDLMVLKAVLTSTGSSGFTEKKIQLDLNFWPGVVWPDALPTHVYCNVTKFNLLY